MGHPQNAMEIFKLLNKSNCRLCEESTCLAFAASVFKGQKELSLCPYIEEEVLQRYDQPAEHQDLEAASLEHGLNQLKEFMPTLDLPAAAQRLGGRFERGKLIIKVLGKDVSVDVSGNISTDIHVHSWLIASFMQYLKSSQGTALSGKWVPLRELQNGKDWGRFFDHRCEKPLKSLADQYTDLFEDMIHLFNGRQVENHYQSDISLVLNPFPNLPLLVCYWRPEDGLESTLNLFFDDTAEANLPIEAIYRLVAGLVVMFEKISLRHGVK